VFESHASKATSYLTGTTFTRVTGIINPRVGQARTLPRGHGAIRHDTYMSGDLRGAWVPTQDTDRPRKVQFVGLRSRNFDVRCVGRRQTRA
jgi:hypothetical protein